MNAPVTRLWPAGSATGVGSLPGTDPGEAIRLILGELPDLPHLPELPERGAGADMIGRGAVLLPGLPVEIQPSGWRLTSAPGAELRRARDFLDRDLDALQEHADGHHGAIKVQVVGPWTLAASIELPSGNRVLSDHGATRDLAESLVEGVRAHVAELVRRLPNSRLVVQVDEPSLPAALAARIPTPSGWGTLRSVDVQLAESRLRDLLAVLPLGGRVVHCCADEPPLRLLLAAGADALSVDLRRLSTADFDVLGEAVDDGVSLWLGVLPGKDPVGWVDPGRDGESGHGSDGGRREDRGRSGQSISLEAAQDPIMRFWSALGFPAAQLADTVVPTPSCGLAGSSAGYLRRVLSVLRDAGRSFAES